MHVEGIVLAVVQQLLRGGANGLVHGGAVLVGDEESNSSGRVGGDLRDGIGHKGINLANELHHLFNQVKVEPDALCLCAQDAGKSKRVRTCSF